MPRADVVNSRVAHCDHGGQVDIKQYRLIFPFEDDEATQGLWWESDGEHHRWRMIGWKAYDPEYEQAIVTQAGCADGISRQHGSTKTEDISEAASEEDPDNKDSDDLSSSFARMGIRSHRTREEMATREERQWFVCYCLCNEYEPARTMLYTSANRVELVQKACAFTGKSILHMVCEEGHINIVNLLLRNGASLETRDFEKNTPLLSALDFGRVDVVSRPVRAGANTTVTNRSGSSFIGKAREALSWQEEQRKYNQRIIDLKPQVSAEDSKEPKEIHKKYNSKGKCVLKYFVDDKPPYVPTDEERERAAACIQRIDERLVCLGSIIEDYESKKAKARFQALLQKDSSIHGEAQAQHIRLYGSFDLPQMTSYIMHNTFTTLTDNLGGPWFV